jgi:hypothetical protein
MLSLALSGDKGEEGSDQEERTERRREGVAEEHGVDSSEDSEEEGRGRVDIDQDGSEESEDELEATQWARDGKWYEDEDDAYEANDINDSIEYLLDNCD